MSSDFWNQRYASHGLVYGEAPNDFLVSVADRPGWLPRSGAALDIGAGEGRNALFLASRGLDVLAVDQSTVGLEKARGLAQQRGLTLRTQAVDLRDFDAAPASLDVVSSIFCHLPTTLRAAVHGRIRRWLRPGGVFVLEAYTPDQLRRDTGGPKDPDMLASLATVLAELGGGFTIEHRAERVRSVVEGSFHGGESSVVQVVARRA